MFAHKYFRTTLPILYILCTSNIILAEEAIQPTKAQLPTTGASIESGDHFMSHPDRAQPGPPVNTNHGPKSVAICRQAVTRTPRSAEAHSNLGEALLVQGRLQEALLSFTIALNLSPAHAGALSGRSRICQALNLHGQAVKDLNKLIGLFPATAEYYYRRGQTLLKLKQVRAAFSDFQKAHDIDASYPRPTLHGQTAITAGQGA